LTQIKLTFGIGQFDKNLNFKTNVLIDQQMGGTLNDGQKWSTINGMGKYFWK